jgi:dienelactone hydrolase
LCGAPVFAGDEIKTDNGATVEVRFIDAGPKSPGVLFFPMCRSDAVDGWMPLAEHLRAAGISSVTVIYRGYGKPAERTPEGDQRPHDADAALAYLRSRVGANASLAVAGSSCGVAMSLMAASKHPEGIRAAVALSGPHQKSQLEFVRNTPALAVFSGASASETPAIVWARALKDASANPASRVIIPDGDAHGTDMFASKPEIAREIAAWLAAQLKGERVRP